RRTVASAANPWVGWQDGIDRGLGGYEEIWRDGKGDGEDAGAARLNSRVERWLEWREGTPARDQPFFIFINYLEPHLPYDPPEPESSRFVAPVTTPAALERLRRLLHSLVVMTGPG